MTDQPGFSVEQVPWDHRRAVALRAEMDDELRARYPAFIFALPDGTVPPSLAVDPADVLATVVAFADDGRPVGHAAVRNLRGDWEIKRVIVTPDWRGRGVGRAMMATLEEIAASFGASRVILHTGDRQPEAVRMYQGLGYRRIPVYEPYASVMPTSFCFEKPLA